MTIRNKTRGRYESQTAEARRRRNDKSTYEFEKCQVCGGTIVIWNGKRGACAMCELKRDKEAAELATEEHKALQIVTDVTAPKLPPAKITTMQQLAEARERRFNQFYYGNQDGLPYFPHQTQEANKSE